MNGCKIEIRYICSQYKQTDCHFFEKDNNIPSLACKFGLPDRKCSNDKANKSALTRHCINVIFERKSNVKKTKA